MRSSTRELYGDFRLLTASSVRPTIRVADEYSRSGGIPKMQRQLMRVLVFAVLGSSAAGIQGELRGQTAATAAAEKFEVTVEHNVAAKTRDGVTLRADIYRPRPTENFQCCWNAPRTTSPADEISACVAAARGYVVVIQDTRGRYASEGEWYTFKNESNDGFDSVEWAAALPYADGKVGMFGVHTSARHNFWRQSRIPRILRVSLRMLPLPTITMAGRTKAARSSSGSIKAGLRD